MRRPWPSPFGRARHAHRYHRRTKRKYRAVAINGFTPEHLHVGRLAGRGSENEDDDGKRKQKTEQTREGERETRMPLYFLRGAPHLDRQGSTSTMYRPTLKDYRSLHLSICSRSFFCGLPLRVPNRSRPTCGLQDPDPRFGFRSNGRAGSQGWQISRGMLLCLLFFAMSDRRTTPTGILYMLHLTRSNLSAHRSERNMNPSSRSLYSADDLS